MFKEEVFISNSYIEGILSNMEMLDPTAAASRWLAGDQERLRIQVG
jgi:hypothetical protein